MSNHTYFQYTFPKFEFTCVPDGAQTEQRTTVAASMTVNIGSDFFSSLYSSDM
jgi:hypothetical protein